MAPGIATVLCVPILLGELGQSGFAALSFVWIGLALQATLDLGSAKTLAFQVSSALPKGDLDFVRKVFQFSIRRSSKWGFLLGLPLAGSITFLVWRAATTHLEAPQLAILFGVLALSAPAVAAASVLRSLLESQSRFASQGLTQAAAGVATLVLPTLWALWGGFLGTMIAAIIGRLIGPTISLALSKPFWPPLDAASPVFNLSASYTNWTTLVTFLGPIHYYVDRAVIVLLQPNEPAGSYAAIFEVLLKIALVSGALATVAFTQMAQHRSDPSKQQRILHDFIVVNSLVMAGVLLAGLVWQAAIVEWIVGASPPKEMAQTYLLALVAVVTMCLSTPLFTFFFAIGKPQVPAIAQLVELPLYLVALVLLVPRAGLLGAAAAWLFRAGVDLAFLGLMARVMNRKGVSLPGIQ